MRWVVIICSLSIVPVVPNKTTVIMPHCLSIGLILILGCEALSLNFVLKWIHFHFEYCRLCHALFFFVVAHMPFYKPTDKNKSVSYILVVGDVSETSQSATFFNSSFPEGKHSSDHDTSASSCTLLWSKPRNAASIWSKSEELVAQMLCIECSRYTKTENIKAESTTLCQRGPKHPHKNKEHWLKHFSWLIKFSNHVIAGFVNSDLFGL